MTGLETTTLMLQGVVPLALIAVAARPHTRRLSWMLDVGVAAAYLLAIGLAGLWLALPRELVLTHAVLLVGAAAWGTRGRGAAPVRPATLRSRASDWGRSLALVALLATSVVAAAGQRMPGGESVDLAFPLTAGTYLVAAGGSNELLNPHRATASGARYRAWVGQSHGVDLVRVGSWGSRAGTLSPADLGGFAIFGDRVSAPCAGKVLKAVDGLPDALPGGGKPPALEGNHVILECGNHWVVLAHLRRGSVCVSAGEHVRAGDALGLVGNSGQSDEPHLHIHVQKPGSEATPLGGAPVPVTFQGRYLVRNDRVHAAPEFDSGHAAHD